MQLLDVLEKMELMLYFLMVLQTTHYKINRYCLQWIMRILVIEVWLEPHLNRVIDSHQEVLEINRMLENLLFPQRKVLYVD